MTGGDGLRTDADFIEAKRPDGLETPLDLAARYFTEGTDEWVKFHQATRGKPENLDARDQPRNDRGSFTRNCDIITVTVPSPEPTMAAGETSGEDAAPASPAPAVAPPRIGRAFPPTGTSVNYGIRRLGKERPDLLEKVKAGEMTPHAAMVEARFTRARISVPAEPPEATARALRRHYAGDGLRMLIEALTELQREAESDADPAGG